MKVVKHNFELEKDKFIKIFSQKTGASMKSLKKYQEIVVLDCETTGLDYQKDQIIELAACLFVFDGEKYLLKDEMDIFIKSDFPLLIEIVNLTGITDQILKEQGISKTEAIAMFYQRFIDNSKQRKLIAAYNAPFDINFITAMLSRHHKDLFDCDFLDILTVYKDRASFPHKLKDAIAHYKLEDKYINSHRAVDDCIACYQVLLSMSEELDDLDKYVNLFGYNPKYRPTHQVHGVEYRPQYYGVKTKLYED